MTVLRSLWPRSVLLRALVGALVALGLVTGCTTLEEKERALTFRVEKRDAGWYSGQPVEVQDVYLPVSAAPDAQRIHAWWWPDADPDAPVVYYLHGVRWNLTGHLRRIEQLRQFGYSVFAIDYRGFGKSDGEMPSEEGVYEDAHVAWRWLVAHERDPAKRYVYGHSLGTAVATHVATDEGARDGMAGLILEGGFTSLPEMAKALAPSWLPIDWLVTQGFETIDKIAKVPAPVLLVHGTGDRLVPHRFSEALYAAAPEPKKLVLVEGGGHYNTSWVGAAQYREAIAELFGVTARGRAAALGPAVRPFAALAAAASR